MIENSNSSAIHIESLGFSYSERSNQRSIFEELSFSVNQGEIVAFVGPSGCGKSTLIKLIAGLLTPISGSIQVLEHLPTAENIRGQIGLLFQRPILLPWLNLLRNVSLPQELSGTQNSSVSPEGALELVGLEGFESHLPKELSGGMQQRAALARAMVTQPKILLLDEPFSSIDEFNRQEMAELLLEVHSKSHFSGILVTHSINEAAFIADRVFILSPLPCKIIDCHTLSFKHARNRKLLDQTEFHRALSCIRSSLM